MNISCRVKEANKKIYNDLGDRYEALDKRRSQDLCIWLKKRLKKILEMIDGEANLLDIGCGGGFVVRAAKGLFPKIYGVDISENILKTLFSYGGFPVCADAQQLPFKDQSIDVTVLFSVAHHLYEHKPVLKEVHRILKVGGALYIDHDMNKCFFNNFSFLINAYRKLSLKKRALKDMHIDEGLYKLSEFHSDGIDSEQLKDYLVLAGFRVIESYYHWYGLSKITNFIFGEKRFSKNIAPLAGFLVQKISV